MTLYFNENRLTICVVNLVVEVPDELGADVWVWHAVRGREGAVAALLCTSKTIKAKTRAHDILGDRKDRHTNAARSTQLEQRGCARYIS